MSQECARRCKRRTPDRRDYTGRLGQILSEPNKFSPGPRPCWGKRLRSDGGGVGRPAPGVTGEWCHGYASSQPLAPRLRIQARSASECIPTHTAFDPGPRPSSIWRCTRWHFGLVSTLSMRRPSSIWRCTRWRFGLVSTLCDAERRGEIDVTSFIGHTPRAERGLRPTPINHSAAGPQRMDQSRVF